MYDSRTKIDLIIEVWEKLDCESVGAKEILAIENAVRERFGPAAVESPMIIARLLADEGAELRHSEIMNLFVERGSDRPYDAAFRNILKLSELRSAAATIKSLEALRHNFAAAGDKEGLRLLREKVIAGKGEELALSKNKKLEPADRRMHAEIAEWLALWLNTPEIFDQWLSLRKRSADFKKNFGDKSSL
ncbi:MAG: hypothetical protein ABI791_00815 [Acidobacteriota bacterium]